MSTVYMTTYTNRFGAGTRVFSTAEARDQYSTALARKIWANHENEEAPEDSSEFWTAFYERFMDDSIEDDQAEIDAESPKALAETDAA